MNHPTANMTITQLLAQYTPLPNGVPYIDYLDCVADYGLGEFLEEHIVGRIADTHHPKYAEYHKSVLIHRLESASHDEDYGMVLSVVTFNGTPVAIVFTYDEDLRDSAVHIIDKTAWVKAKTALVPLLKWSSQSTPYMANSADSIANIFPTRTYNYIGIVSKTSPSAPQEFHLYESDDPRINQIIAQHEDPQNPFTVTEVTK